MDQNTDRKEKRDDQLVVHLQIKYTNNLRDKKNCSK